MVIHIQHTTRHGGHSQQRTYDRDQIPVEEQGAECVPRNGNFIENNNQMNGEYSFWMIWGITCEGNKRWHMGRFLIDTTAEEAAQIVRDRLRGGCGDDYSEILEAEWGYDDGVYTDYCEQTETL